MSHRLVKPITGSIQVAREFLIATLSEVYFRFSSINATRTNRFFLILEFPRSFYSDFMC